MCEKLSEYIGYWVRIQYDSSFCAGEIISIDANSLVLINSSINDVPTSTKYLGINKTLIKGMDIISSPIDKNIAKISHSSGSSTSLNVYTSSTQPPVIQKGGSSSAVHRNFSKLINISQETQLIEKVHNSRSFNSQDHYCRPRLTSSGSVPKNHNWYNGSKSDAYKSRNFSDQNFRTRKMSSGSMSKEPSWFNYQFNDDSASFDFDSNLALFEKLPISHNMKTHRKVSESVGYESSDSGGLTMTFNGRNTSEKHRSQSIGFEPYDFLSHEDSNTISFGDHTKESNDVNPLKETKDVFTELKRMGIIPSPINCKVNDCPNIPYDEPKSIEGIFIKEHNFLQQPDIVQEVTKSQLCNPELQLSDNFTILSISKSSQDFHNFSDFWKLDNDCNFPVFSLDQRNKIFECANKFGFDVRTIAEDVGKTLSEFVIHQVGGSTRLNKLNVNQIPKIAVILGRCQSSAFAASVAKSLLIIGCCVIVYVDVSCHPHNDDVEMEIKSLSSVFEKLGRNSDLSFLTSDFKDLENKTFDYIITGLESDLNFKTPEEELVQWCLKQKTPILCIDPPTTVYIPWKVAVFIGVPTRSSKSLFIRTSYVPQNGFFKPRTDGVCGLEVDKMFRKPDGLVILCDANLPMAVYSLLNLNYKPPFNSKKWIRLYRENELLFVE